MYSNKKIIAIILARGGSKGVPKKNIKLLKGKPLIVYTIESALKSKYLDRVIVSTDNREIAEISKKNGAEVIKRPKRLATNRAKVIDAVLHAIDILKKERYRLDIVVLLQPTSPLRDHKDIDETIKLFLVNKPEFLVSVYRLEHSSYCSFQLKGKYLKPISGWKYFKLNRQEIPKTYMPNGAIYISTPKAIKKYRMFLSTKTIPYIMSREKSVDIDEEIDFKIAEFLLKNHVIKKPKIKKRKLF